MVNRPVRLLTRFWRADPRIDLDGWLAHLDFGSRLCPQSLVALAAAVAGVTNLKPNPR
jgi:hypothetical protein